MSEFRFTDGNLIILYAVHKGRSADGSLPEYIAERVKIGLETYDIVMRSKADKHKTMVMIIGEQAPAEKVKDTLVKGGIKPEIIAIDTDSQNMAQTIDRVYNMIK